MADPLAAFAAAGNALQFIEAGLKLASKAHEYYRDGGNSEHQALQNLMQQTMASCAHLQSSMATNVPGTTQPGPLRALYMANQQCLVVSGEFFRFVDQLKVKSSRNPLKSVYAAVRSIKHIPDIDTLTKRVEHARSNLTLSLLVYLESRKDDLKLSTDINCAALQQEARKITNETRSLRQDIERLTQEFMFLNVTDDHTMSALSNLQVKRHDDLEDVVRRLTKLLQSQNTSYRSAVTDMNRLMTTMSEEILARHRILESLNFTEMRSRRNRIVRAHGSTYQWIFKNKENNVAVWDDFIAWLSDAGKRDMYWILGKPGSGKSTLLRELDERITSVESTTPWAGESALLKASCYFWHAGTVNERSISGLLKSLSYQLLQQRPELIDAVIAQSRWCIAHKAALRFVEWEMEELVKLLEDFITASESKILLLIDGLDEHESPDESHDMLVDLLRRLTKSASVKACVASRPWVVFRDASRDCPQLRLDLLTVDDIKLFVQDKLYNDKQFMRLQQRHTSLTEKLASAIVEKAQGVFLWVRLVVRDLLKMVQDGCRPASLSDELERIPADLEGYFLRIMTNIEPRYREDAAMIMLSTLTSLDYVRFPSSTVAPGPPLLLSHLDYLDRNQDPCFAINSTLTTINYEQQEEDIDYLLETLDRRLTSRCMGLLEVDEPFSWACNLTAHPWAAKIEFLHRTVRDFLMLSTTQNFLRQYIQVDFDPYLFRCNTLLVNIGVPAGESQLEQTLKLDSVECLLNHLRAEDLPQEIAFRTFDKLIDLLAPQIENLAHHLDISAHNEEMLKSIIFNWHLEQSDRFSLAIEYEYMAYLQSRLDAQTLFSRHGRPLLDCALRRSSPTAEGRGTFRCPNLDIIQVLLEKGATFDDGYEGPNSVPIWAYLVVFLIMCDPFDKKQCLTILDFIMSQGVSRTVTERDLEHTLEVLGRCGGQEHCYRTRLQKVDPTRQDEPLPHNLMYEKTRHCISYCLSTIDPSRADLLGSENGRYTLMDVLISLRQGPSGFGEPLFDNASVSRMWQKHRKKGNLQLTQKRRLSGEPPPISRRREKLDIETSAS